MSVSLSFCFSLKCNIGSVGSVLIYESRVFGFSWTCCFNCVCSLWHKTEEAFKMHALLESGGLSLSLSLSHSLSLHVSLSLSLSLSVSLSLSLSLSHCISLYISLSMSLSLSLWCSGPSEPHCSCVLFCDCVPVSGQLITFHRCETGQSESRAFSCTKNTRYL